MSVKKQDTDNESGHTDVDTPEKLGPEEHNFQNDDVEQAQVQDHENVIVEEKA